MHDLVTRSYREIVFDELLEPVFSERVVAEVDWAEHIPKLIDCWRWILFGTGRYPASVTKTHRRLHELAPIGPEICDRWFALWAATIDAGWTGPTQTVRGRTPPRSWPEWPSTSSATPRRPRPRRGDDR